MRRFRGFSDNCSSFIAFQISRESSNKIDYTYISTLLARKAHFHIHTAQIALTTLTKRVILLNLHHIRQSNLHPRPLRIVQTYASSRKLRQRSRTEHIRSVDENIHILPVVARRDVLRAYGADVSEGVAIVGALGRSELDRATGRWLGSHVVAVAFGFAVAVVVGLLLVSWVGLAPWRL